MRDYILDGGFKTHLEYLYKLVLPAMGISIVLFAIIEIFIRPPYFLSYGVLLIGVLFVAIYPYIVFEQRNVAINERIHLFITYAGTLSTLRLNRTMLFQKIADEKEYGELRDIAERILYMAKKWNLGYAKTCRMIAKTCPSRIFADFLDRMAAVLDFGEDIEIFLTEEQDAMMEDYANEYTRAIENIKLLQDIFISITISIAFAMSAALLMPLLMGISIMVVVKYSLLGMVIMDVLLVILIKGFIPSDKICHTLSIMDEGTKKAVRMFFIIAPISFMLTGILLYLEYFPFLFNLAIGFTPLIIIGIYATQEENEVFRRDKAFPAFIRALGGTISTRGGGVTSSLGALRVHDFGVLDSILTNVHRRLVIGSDRFKAWLYFAGESGSNLINYFIHIFAKSVYLGGDAIKISEIISKNFSRLMSLRKLRLQLASGLRGALYGALVGFITTIYMSTAITEMLSTMFGSALSDAQGQENMANMMSAILPTIPSIDSELVGFYIGIIVVFHALISSLIIKMVDGGSKYAALQDFVFMVWIGAVLSWVIPFLSSWAFGSLSIGGAG